MHHHVDSTGYLHERIFATIVMASTMGVVLDHWLTRAIVSALIGLVALVAGEVIKARVRRWSDAPAPPPATSTPPPAPPSAGSSAPPSA